MAKGPQVENGFTKIADEFLDAMVRYRLAGEQMQCFLFIIRKTWGWEKREDAIPLSQFVASTGLKKPTICRALKALEAKGLIIIKNDNAKAKTYRINKQYGNWKALTKKITVSKKITSVIKNDNKTLSFLSTSIDTTINNSSINKFTSDSDEVRLSELLYDLILANNPKHKKPNIQTWAKYIDLAIRRDNRTPDDIEAVIRWAQSDHFWWSNILSTKKLREQFDALYSKMKGGNNGNPANGTFRAEPGKYSVFN